MPIHQINLSVGERRLAMKLELDDGRPNEKHIRAFLANRTLYEQDICLALARILAPGDAAVDVGANIGFFTVLMASLCGPSGRVVSVEPGAANLERLAHNIALNDAAWVTVVGQPLAASAGEVGFYINSDDSGGNALWDPALYPGNPLSKAARIEERMRATTLDDTLDRLGIAGPKVAKIDTEGAEQRVLEGAARLLGRRGVPFVIAELHEFGLRQMGCSQQSLRSLMEGHGYSTFLLYQNGALPKLVPPGTRIVGKVILNLLFSTPQSVGACWPAETFDPRTGS